VALMISRDLQAIGDQAITKDGNSSWVESNARAAEHRCSSQLRLLRDLTADSFNKILDDLAAGKKVKPGPQVDRQLSAPIGGATTLKEKA
jgi:NADH-quinone oxidoreductase subunit E